MALMLKRLTTTDMNKLYVLVGVPASGKTTWVKNQNWVQDCVVVSTDEFVEDYARECGLTYSEVFDDYMSTAVRLMADKVIRARKAGKDIIWDQTSCTVETRAKKIRMLPDYYKIAVVFKTPPTIELQERLVTRPGKNVPWEVVSSMAQNLEAEPVTQEEGFDEIWYT
jgi:predicted kinase